MMPTYYPPPNFHDTIYPNNISLLSSPWGKLSHHTPSQGNKIQALSPDSDMTNNNEG